MSAILQRPRKAKHRQSPGMCALAGWFGLRTLPPQDGLITAPEQAEEEADCSWIMAGGQSAMPSAGAAANDAAVENSAAASRR
jgi:hypothetical protein